MTDMIVILSDDW